ncbi:MAG: molybdenum cofactor guanylyltransferase [Ignavibacteriae bacterium]|nr:molybdenum cofactor guanylyltransferase [Ignavibacteriota bacterium]
MYNDITGIILAGGKSTRMGQDKSFLKFGYHTVIEHDAELMKSIFHDVIIITNEPDKYKILGFKCYEDIFKGIGPLGGIHSGLTNSENELNFVISCDIPFITKEVIEFIISQQENYDAVITKADGYIQQLCGLYRRKLIQQILQLVQTDSEVETRNNIQHKRKCKVLSLIEMVNARIIDFETEYENYKPGTFFNINKPDDYDLAIKMLNDIQ